MPNRASGLRRFAVPARAGPWPCFIRPSGHGRPVHVERPTSPPNFDPHDRDRPLRRHDDQIRRPQAADRDGTGGGRHRRRRCLRGQYPCRGKTDLLRQWRLGGGQPASGDRTADPPARLGGARLLARLGADPGSGDADRLRQRLRLRPGVRAPAARPWPAWRRTVRHHHLRPLAQRGAGAGGGAGDGDRHRRDAGRAGQPALEQCDLALLVPDGETARIQECHIALGHAVLELLEDRLVARPIA